MADKKRDPLREISYADGTLFSPSDLLLDRRLKNLAEGFSLGNAPNPPSPDQGETLRRLGEPDHGLQKRPPHGKPLRTFR